MKTDGPLKTGLDMSVQDEILSKLEIIVLQDDYQELKNDFSIKIFFKFIFNEVNINKIFFEKDNSLAKILFPFIELVYLLFQLDRDKREELYQTNIDNIKDQKIKIYFQMFGDLLKLHKITNNEQLFSLYNKLEKKYSKKNNTLFNEIYWSMWRISFSFNLKKILKYQIFNAIKEYLNNFNVKCRFIEFNIDMTDNTALNLLVDFFDNNEINNSFIISLLLIKYENIKNIIKEFNKEFLGKAIKNTYSQLKKIILKAIALIT